MSALLSEVSPRSLREAYAQRAARLGLSRITYDEWFAAFRNLRLSFRDISELFGVSTWTLRKIYQQDFYPLTGISARQRERLRHEYSHEALLREPSDPNTMLGHVAYAAEQAGLTVRRVLDRTRWFRCSERDLEIQGLRCRIHRARSIQEPTRVGGPVYARFLFTRSTEIIHAAHILLLTLPKKPIQLFVVPAQKVDAICPGKNIRLWFLVEPHLTGPFRNQLDWPQYENAWHFLE